MDSNATARAQAADSLDEAAKALKRTIATCRTTLQTVRQVQAQVIGIEVETIQTQPRGGHSGNASEDTLRR